jgi:uncharacterized membrane protein YkoI
MGMFTIALVLALSCTALAHAEHDRARALRQAGVTVPLEQILEAVRAQYPGHPLETELEEWADDYVYEIEWLGNDGTVRTLHFDAQSGRPLAADRGADCQTGAITHW